MFAKLAKVTSRGQPDTPPKTLEEALQKAGVAKEYRLEGSKLGGSVDARKAVRVDTGTTHVLKLRKSVQQCANEAAACKLYRALGAAVPDTQLLPVKPGKPAVAVVIQEFVEGATLLKLKEDAKDPNADPEWAAALRALIDAVHESLRFHFLLDCLFANWDVIGGRGGDNIVVTHDGRGWRVDNAGVFSIRAQGDPREAWTELVTELSLMREADGGNPECAEVFAGIADKYIVRQLKSLQDYLACHPVGGTDCPLQALTDADQTIFAARVAYVADVVRAW